MDEKILGYIAGIIDGEGCIGAYNTRTKKDRRASYYQLTVRVAMKSPRVITFLKEHFPCNINTYQKGDSTIYAWQLRNRNAESFLRVIASYLIEKKEQAELAIEFCEFRRKQRSEHPRNAKYTDDMLDERDVYVDKLKLLKRGQ